MDHNGLTMKLSYKHFSPRVIIYPNGSFDGYMPRIAKAIADMLNLSVEYSRVLNPASGRLPNGSFAQDSDLGQIIAGEIDGSVWGYIASFDRAEVLDLTLPVAHGKIGAVIRTPKSDDVSMKNYLAEFENNAWFFVAVSTIIFWAMFGIILHFGSSRMTKKDSMVMTVTIMLRTLINKVLFVIQ